MGVARWSGSHFLYSWQKCSWGNPCLSSEAHCKMGALHLCFLWHCAPSKYDIWGYFPPLRWLKAGFLTLLKWFWCWWPVWREMFWWSATAWEGRAKRATTALCGKKQACLKGHLNINFILLLISLTSSFRWPQQFNSGSSFFRGN